MQQQTGAEGKPPRHSQSKPQNNLWRLMPTVNDSAADHSGDTSSEFFSPPPVVGGVVLPRNHDSSWIGARQSPIPSFDDEVKATTVGDEESDDDENDEEGAVADHSEDATEKYHRALHNSLKQFDYFYHGQQGDTTTNEKSPLLGENGDTHVAYSSMARNNNNNQNHNTNRVPISQGNNKKSEKSIPRSIHPLWNGASSEERRRNASKYAKYYTKRKAFPNHKECCRGWKWGHLLMAVAGCYILIMSVYELVELSNNEENHEEDAANTWRWRRIWSPRNPNTIIQFGGMHTERILFQTQYWRLFSSLFQCASFPEWILLSLSWTICIYSNPTFRPKALTWTGTYLACATVGQLWMMAWDKESETATAATWGTSGVLINFGMDRPGQRDMCFLTSLLFVLQAWLELPCNSVFGAAGACLFGWLLSATAAPVRLLPNHTPRPSSHVRMILLLSFVLVPTLCIAFR